MNSLPSLFSSFSFVSKKERNKNNFENNNINNIKSIKHNFLLFSSPNKNNNNNNNNIKYIKDFEKTFYNNYYNHSQSQFNSPIHYKIKSHNKKIKRKIKNKNKIIDENEQEFLSNIITEGNYQNINKNNKFNLSTDLNYDEKILINNIINNNKSQTNQTLNVFYKKQSFNSPFNSKYILNCNSQIMKTLNDMRMLTQCNKFYKKINEVNKKNYFLKKMPKIRVSKFSNPETNFIFKNIQNNNILTLSQNLNNNNSNNNNTINSNSNNNNNNNNNNDINNNKENNKNIKKLKHKNSTTPLENILGIPNNLISRDKLFSSLRIFFTKLSTQLHPSSRGKFSFTITEDFNLYIFGGIQSKCLNDLWKYNFSKNIWHKEEIINESESPLPRYAHSMSIFNDNIYIFGGSISLKHLLIHNRENNISVFDMKSKKYYYPLCNNSRNVPWRKNHIGIGVGNTLFIYGGINDEGEILNDFWVFEYLKLKWNPLEYRSLIKIPYLAYHSACLVLKNRAILYHNDFNIYKIPEGNINKNVKNKPKIEGIYIFGGISNDNNNNNENNNNSSNNNNYYFKDLFVIKIGTKPVDIFRLPTRGKMPSPRIDFSMSYYNYLNFLVVYGGKYEGVIINEIMFLDLETLSWIKPLYDENEINKISENIIICIEEKIYVLGGLGNNGFEKFEFNIINFDLFESNYNNNNINGIMENFSN